MGTVTPDAHDPGGRLREWRRHRGLTQAMLADELSITQASVSNYERGQRDMPVSILIEFASALNVSVGQLLDVPDVIVVRDSALGRVVTSLQSDPEFDRAIRGLLAHADAERSAA